MQLHPGDTLLDRFQIERLLGQGGMATIYAAHDLTAQKSVALKVGLRERARLEREFSLLKGLTDRGIISVEEFFTHDTYHFFSMELLSGGTLHDEISATGKLSLQRTLAITRKLLSTLSSLHSSAVLHQDLKPENILLREDGTPVLIDFGIAREANESGATVSTAGEGTFDYKSPEQLRGDLTDPRTDIFSLGVVVYEMLSGSPPFYSEAISEHLDQRLEGPKPLSGTGGGIPSWVDEFISICTWNDLEGRFQTAPEAVSFLDEMENERSGIFSTFVRIFR